MNKFKNDGRDVFVPAILTCGGIVGMFYPYISHVQRIMEGQSFADVLPSQAMVLPPVVKMEHVAEETGGMISAWTVLQRFGLPAHFQDMAREVSEGLDSVAKEIPTELRAVAHTLLPLEDGFYRNEDVEIRIENLVEIGPQDGNLVAHLAGCFASLCGDEEIAQLKKAQARDADFMSAARKMHLIDYGNYPGIRRATELGKEGLGL